MKIVLTGGPSAGKTSIVDILFRSNSDQVVVVEEAASILYRGGFPRAQEPKHVQAQQCAIYAVQRALEDIRLDQAGDRTLICDRGSLDGLAYWMGSEASFFKKIASTMKAEVRRYDWVIHLDSAGPQNYQSSSLRTERVTEALKINDLVKHAWRKHPRRLVIPSSSDFMDKVAMVLKCLTLIHEHKSVDEIRSRLAI